MEGLFINNMCKMKTIYYLSGPHINVEKGYWLYDQLVNDGFDVKPFYMYKSGHSCDFSTKVHQYTRTLRLLFSSRKEDLVLLYDVTSVFIIAGILLSLFHLDRNVVAVNFMGTGYKEGYSKWKRPLIRLGLNKIKIGVNNENLIDFYSEQLRIDKKRFFVIKDCAANVDTSNRDCTPENPPYVFMGGNVHRDWCLFKDIVRRMPNVNFVAVLGNDELDDMLGCKNLKVFKKISLSEFNNLVAHSKIVLLALKTEMQGGQLVAFQGSMYKKPVIITHCMSIDTYYDDDDIIKVKIGDADACVDAITRLLNDEKLSASLGDKGYRKIRNLTPESIYTIIKEQF